MFSLGVRSTYNTFSHDGNGLGVGGHFRIQLTDRINTEWFADYMSVGTEDVRSNYAHIGWSVIFYPLKDQEHPKRFQPYISAGHCFDYNKKIAVRNPENFQDRWGSAVQAGIGTHINITERFDISISSLYMIHLTPEIIAHTHNNNGNIEVDFDDHNHAGLEGHLLTTISINYKIGQLWGRD
jgi:hypothetical protein